MAKKPQDQGGPLQVEPVRTGYISLRVIGTSPMIYNAMSEKAKHELLLPRGRKTIAERAENLKHNPIEEYRSSVYAYRDDNHPTRLLAPVGAFKKGAMVAALRSPGVRKTEVGQLLWVDERDIDMYGVPELYMCVVRSSDMNRTPDIRTRAVLRHWACSFKVTYVRPLLSDQVVVNLFATAGVIAGVGDGRQEKGTFNFGQFELVSEETKKQYDLICKEGGRQAQDRALKDPEFFDFESEKLFNWYTSEVAKMGERSPIRSVKIKAA